MNEWSEDPKHQTKSKPVIPEGCCYRSRVESYYVFLDIIFPYA